MTIILSCAQCDALYEPFGTPSNTAVTILFPDTPDTEWIERTLCSNKCAIEFLTDEADS